MKSASPPVYDNNSHNICFMNDDFPRPEIGNFIVVIRDDKTEVNCTSTPQCIGYLFQRQAFIWF